MLVKEFERQVRETSDNLAVKTFKRQLTYKQLNNIANHIAGLLLSAGVKIDQSEEQTIAALIFEQGEGMIAGTLGALKANMVYVPFSPEYPVKRLVYMLSNSGAKIIITNDSNMPLAESLCKASESDVHIINIDTLDYSTEAGNPGTASQKKDKAYILYTSGSTGVPKGVVQSRENVYYYTSSYGNCISLTHQDRMTLFSTFSHDAAVVDIFSGLLNGACLYPINPRKQLSIAKLADWLAEERITVWHSIPTLYRLFANSLTERETLPNIRCIVLGGENVLLNDAMLAKKHFPGASFINLYGQSEASFNSFQIVPPNADIEKITIGKPIDGTMLLVVDEEGAEIDPLKTGEIVIACRHLALGYWKDEVKTNSVFSEDCELERIYWTGDLGRLLLDGSIEYIGRKDFQMKIRGYRVEAAEIENKLSAYKSVKEAAVIGKNSEHGGTMLAAYYSAHEKLTGNTLRDYLLLELPDYMVPSYFIQLDELPRTSNGKTDRKALLELPVCEHNDVEYIEPRNEIEKKIAEIWRSILDTDKVNIRENFFDAGGNSMMLILFQAKLEEVFPGKVTIGDIFSHTTVEKLSSYILSKSHASYSSTMDTKESPQKDIAIIGIALKLPGVCDVYEYFDKLCDGYDFIKEFPEARQKDTDSYLEFAQMNNENTKYSKGAFLEEIDKFDYRFFKLTPKEASLMDPNQRLFLETAWKAIEDAGYGGKRLLGSCTGVFLGFSSHGASAYRQYIADIEPESLSMSTAGNIPPIIASRISYILDLKGPSMLIDTACSASLVSVHAACQSIRNGECSMALAGSVKLHLLPLDNNTKLGIEASDYKAKTFDDSSDGTGMGEGAAVIVLKPLSKAEQDGDPIYAVIKGSAVNHDGASIGLTAPNAAAQEEVIVKAWQNAEVDPKTITYIEAHGTGTKLGDPIEIEGLTRAFRRYTAKKQFCAIGSVKTNIGHLGNASGIFGLIKAVLSLKYKKLFPTIHFKRPNRNINFADAPVYVNDRLKAWESLETPRRCGVSSFGISGTNCHMVLEEAPIRGYVRQEPEKTHCILALSAKSESALRNIIKQYSNLLNREPDISPISLCYTANTGREHYSVRTAIVFDDLDSLKKRLKEMESGLSGIKGSIIGDSSIEAITAVRYINGEDINWESLYENKEIIRLNLPSYPFDKECCWLDIPADRKKNAKMQRIFKLLDKISGAVQLPAELEKEIAAFKMQSGMNELDNNIIEHIENKDDSYTATEKHIMRIWLELLGYSKLSITDNYYELGGDSIIALNIVNKLNKEAGIQATVKDLLEHPTIQRFASAIDVKAIKNCGQLFSGLKPVAKANYYIASSAQKRIYMLQQLNPDSIAYNMPNALLINGRLDIKKLTEAFKGLVNRHDSLRTSFMFKEGEIFQIIASKVSFDLQQMQSSKTPEELLKEFVCPFDLGQAPLIRAALVEADNDRYILMFDVHHIVFDGASMSILVKEMLDLYQGTALPTLKLQYKDYSEWQHSIAGSKWMKEQEQYWLNIYNDSDIPVLNLPCDFSRPAVKNFEGDRVIRRIGRKVLNSLKDICSKNNTTLYTILLTAFKTMLYRYTGQKDIVVGSPVHGRSHADLMNIIGVFINTIALRSFPLAEKTFSEYLNEINKIVIDGQTNQLYQFETLVEKVQPRRDMSRSPIFDAMFTMQNIEIPSLNLEGIHIEPIVMNHNASKFDLHLSAMERDNDLELMFEYDSKLFMQDRIERMTGHYICILNSIIRNSEEKLSKLNMLAEDELLQIKCVFNAKELEYAKDRYFHRTFEELAERNPQQIAVIYKDRCMTYRELNSKANSLAWRLKKAGVKPDSIVALYLERSLEMAVAVLGILKAGGAYLPIAPGYPKERVSFMLKDSNAMALLTFERFKHCLDYSGTVLMLDNKASYEERSENPECNITPKNLAYVIYTSGSTGEPKGVMIEHYSIINRINWMQKKYPIGTGDRILQKTPYTFDVSVWELLWWTITGSSLCFLEPDGEKDPKMIVDSICNNGISVIHFVPSMLSIFLDYVEANGCQSSLKSLKNVFASGETLGVKQVEKFNRLLNNTNGTVLTNLYGPTEAAVDVSWFECSVGGENGGIPIGRPIDNIQLYIVDTHDNLQPAGIPGELCIAGHGLARGYLKREQLTAEKFVQNPFNPGTRMYHTGDLAKWEPDGNIIYLGRIDSQVKIKGVRIELCEIEHILLGHKEVKEAVAVDRTDEEGNHYICAYIVVNGNITVLALNEHLKSFLPDYMIPAKYVVMEKLPLSANGKADRNALPEHGCNLATGVTYREPRNADEEKLLNVWRDVLCNDRIGIKDNFFSAGGDSFKALKIISTINGRLSLTDIFRYPTIEQLSDNLLKKREGAALLNKLTKAEDGQEQSPALVCIPYGGGSSVIYKPLADAIAINKPGVPIYSISIPGHEAGGLNTQLDTVSNVARLCVTEIKNTIKRPLVLYGHCVGAALALEISRLLLEEGMKVKAVLLGAVLPVKKRMIGSNKLDIYKGKSDKDIHEFLKRLGGFDYPMEMRELSFVMDSFRHDVIQMRDYFLNVYPKLKKNKLNFPIYCILGRKDPLTKGYLLRYMGWKKYSGEVHPIIISGAGHYFIKSHATELSQIISQIIK